MVCMKRKRNWRVLSSKWYIYTTPPLTPSGKVAEKLQEPETVGDHCEALFSGCNEAIACMNHSGCNSMPMTCTMKRHIKSQHVWGGAHKISLYLRSCWQLMAAKGWESQVFKGLWPQGGYVHPNRWPSIHAHTGSTKWSHYDRRQKEHMKFGGNGEVFSYLKLISLTWIFSA